jgi:hypothetical protein
MSKIARAKIQWIPAKEGGRRITPCTRYSTVARFDDAMADWPDTAWSLVVEVQNEAKDSQETIASVHFLVPDAPDHLLHSGSRFELFEGHRVVASGRILDEAEV